MKHVIELHFISSNKTIVYILSYDAFLCNVAHQFYKPNNIRPQKTINHQNSIFTSFIIQATLCYMSITVTRQLSFSWSQFLCLVLQPPRSHLTYSLDRSRCRLSIVTLNSERDERGLCAKSFCCPVSKGLINNFA